MRPGERRRSLSHVGGETVMSGDPEAARLLAHALDVSPAGEPSAHGGDDDADRAHVHGFHSYPARMHPVTAARLVDAFAPEGGVVLDPFCGSGTVLVEAMLAGRDAIGTDLNPLAVRLSRCKTRPREAEDLAELVAAAKSAAAYADERRAARAGATRRFPEEDVLLFEPHVLLELDSLRSAISGAVVPKDRASDAIRDDLSLVQSSLLVKLSKKRGDTSLATAKRRTAAGYTSKLFVKKTEELARRLGELARQMPDPWPQSLVVAADATELDPKRLLGHDLARVDAIITSPPYAATYDYVAHHALRLRWLDLDKAPLEHRELGARRTYARLSPSEAVAAWTKELAAFLASAARVARPGAPLVLLIADSALGGVPMRADELVADAVDREGSFVRIARAAQSRPHFHGPTLKAFERRPRAEHALLLERAR